MPSGIPDENSTPTAHIGFNHRFLIARPSGLPVDEVWAADIILTPDPICFGSFTTTYEDVNDDLMLKQYWVTDTGQTRFMNPQIEGFDPTLSPYINYLAMRPHWNRNVRGCRPTYYSATIEVDAPTLKDQGMLAACQYQINPWEFGGGSYNDTGNGWTRFARPTSVIPFAQFSTYSEMMERSSSYSGKAKDGAYLPIKLTKRSLEFTNTNASILYHSDWDTFGGGQSPPQGAYISEGATLLNLSSVNHICNPLVPVPDICFLNNSIAQGGAGMPRLTDQIGHVCLRGLSDQASVYVTIRSGFQVECAPGSVYLPLMKIPDRADPTAVTAYFAISRELADAYPAEYNSLGLLLPVIADVAAAVLPAALPLLGAAWREGKKLWNKTFNPEEKQEVKQEVKKEIQREASGSNSGQAIIDALGGLSGGATMYTPPRNAQSYAPRQKGVPSPPGQGKRHRKRGGGGTPQSGQLLASIAAALNRHKRS